MRGFCPCVLFACLVPWRPEEGDMPWSWSYRWLKGCVYAENWSQVFSTCSWLTSHLSSFNNPELDVRRASRKTTKKKSWLNVSKWRSVLTKCSENRARGNPAVSSECTIDQTKGRHGPQKILRKQHGWLGTRAMLVPGLDATSESASSTGPRPGC